MYVGGNFLFVRCLYIAIFLCQGGVVTLEDAATVLLEEHDEKNVKYKSEFLYFKVKEIWPYPASRQTCPLKCFQFSQSSTSIRHR